MSSNDKEGWRFINIGLFMLVNAAILQWGTRTEGLLFCLGWAIGTFLTRAQL